MPPKRARNGTSSKKAVVETKAGVKRAARQQAPEVDDSETQVDADSQYDAEVQSSEQADSSNPNIADDAMASTADGTAAPGATPDTEVSSDDETFDEPDAEHKVQQKTDVASNKKEDGVEQETRKKKRKTDPNNFMPYLHKVQKQTHPDSSMSKIAMQIMNDFIKDVFSRVAETACSLCKKQKRATLQAHDIKCAVKLIIGGELADHTMAEGSRALRTYNENTDLGPH